MMQGKQMQLNIRRQVLVVDVKGSTVGGDGGDLQAPGSLPELLFGLDRHQYTVQ